MKISFTVFGNDPLGFPQSCFTTLNLLNSGSFPSASDTFSFFFSANHFHSNKQKTTISTVAQIITVLISALLALHQCIGVSAF